MWKKTEVVTARPNIYAHHDYRVFLKAWLDYLRAERGGFSMRSLARDAGVAPGYLPMVTGGKRRLTQSAARKLGPHLGLRRSEQEFLRLLVIFGNARSASDRLLALTAMRRSPAYRRANPKEAEVHEYLTHWYYVAIREMTGLRDFELAADWIRARLRFNVDESAVRRALEFLVDNGYIAFDADGTPHPPDKDLLCTSEVYRTALRHYHREALGLATEALDAVPIEERFVMGYTLPIRERDLDKAKQVIEEAVTRLQGIADRARKADSVYHVEMALFPLTRAGVPDAGKDRT